MSLTVKNTDHAGRVIVFRKAPWGYVARADLGLPDVRNAGQIYLGGVHRAYSLATGRGWAGMRRGERIGPICRTRIAAARHLAMHADMYAGVEL